MKKLFRFIGLILKGIWKSITFLRIAILNLSFLLIIALLYFGYTKSTDVPSSVEKTPSALVLNLSGPIVEQGRNVNPMDSFSESLFGREVPKENVLFDVVETIRHAQKDEQILGIVLALGEMPETNLTKLRYIAKALNEFKAAGKSIYAVGDFYNQSQYYLASFADKVFLAPDGAVLIKGYSAYSMYYKTLLEKLDVTTHVFRVGTYKSAVEPFLRDDMSDEAKQSASRWLTQLWGAFSDDIASNRRINASTLNPTMDELLAKMKAANGDLAQLSLDMNLVDQLATRKQVRQYLKDTYGSNDEDSYNAIGYYEYQAGISSTYNVEQDDIAVIVASGAIMDGNQPRGTVGGETVAALLRETRTNDNIKAVVLRVDSPGGSAFASEVIRNEIVALREAGKPVVASMSSLAASGGYWISMSADKIIAQPTTLTGSIGIFSVITTFEKGFNNIGIYTDGIGTSPFSGEGLTTGLSQGASQAFQMGIEHGYQRFISLVSENRDIDLEQVDAIAQGRVWTGHDAVQHGLVDQIGDFDAAVAMAADLANLNDYNLNWLEEPLTPAQQFMQEFMSQVQIGLGLDISAWLPVSLQPITQQVRSDISLLNQFNDPKGHYAFCLPCKVN